MAEALGQRVTSARTSRAAVRVALWERLSLRKWLRRVSRASGHVRDGVRLMLLAQMPW